MSETPPCPTPTSDLADAAHAAWREVWDSRIGGATAGVSLREWLPPAPMVGLMFEGLLARTLALRFPALWRQGSAKGEKDLVCLSDPQASIEVKVSGQGGVAIYGNRSYGRRKEDNEVDASKDGYYLTANFTDDTLYLLRFGWLTHEDWVPQASPRGQSASLRPEAYRERLLPIPGDYTLDAPLGVLPGVGATFQESAASRGYRTLRDLLVYRGRESALLQLAHQVRKHEGDPRWWATPMRSTQTTEEPAPSLWPANDVDERRFRRSP